MGTPYVREAVQDWLDYITVERQLASNTAEAYARGMLGRGGQSAWSADALTVSDHMYVARWLLHRIAEDYDVVVSFAAKPMKGDWNGAGAHTNFSTKAMRESYDPIIAACEALGTKADEHVAAYGADIEHRLTGAHETAPWHEFSYGVSDRGASVRIPWQVEVDKKGYIEDRRPNANMDPYVVTRLITDTVCSALGK